VTPENIAKHTAGRVNDIFGENNANILDGFCGVGGNTIQFAKKCGFCVGVDLDPVKVEYT
jgi:trimethylguanosine synthase